jgi:hypothetical protein
MPARAMKHDRSFVGGLLDPNRPVPLDIKGRPPKRYAVYRNNVTVGLVRAMEANFPAIRRLLGEVYFAGLAQEFVQRHPPRSPLMFHYGAEFADFLEQQDDLSTYPYLADVARLEQLWRAAYHGGDAAILVPAVLAACAADELMAMALVPHPAMRLIASRCAVFDLFRTNREAHESASTDPAPPQNVMLTRPHLDVQLHLLGPVDYAFVAALSSGLPLGAAADAAEAASSSFDLAAILARLMQAGAFCSLKDNRRT